MKDYLTLTKKRKKKENHHSEDWEHDTRLK
jgi:hypothetical protein